MSRPTGKYGTHSHPLVKIGIVSDARSGAIADHSLALLKASAYAEHPALRTSFRPEHTQMLSQALSSCDVALAHVGIPGLMDYERYLHGFLDGYAAASAKPPTALVTHDAQHTEYTIRRWLAGHRNDQPVGALTIVEPRRGPFDVAMLEETLNVLMQAAPSLSIPRRGGPPCADVSIRSLTRRTDTSEPALT